MATRDETPVRIPNELLQRATDLSRRMSEHPSYRYAGLTKTAVLRMALGRGLDLLDSQLDADSPTDL